MARVCEWKSWKTDKMIQVLNINHEMIREFIEFEWKLMNDVIHWMNSSSFKFLAGHVLWWNYCTCISMYVRNIYILISTTIEYTNYAFLNVTWYLWIFFYSSTILHNPCIIIKVTVYIFLIFSGNLLSTSLQASTCVCNICDTI